MTTTIETKTPLLKRAYQLARSGACRHLNDICRQLQNEGYARTSIEEHLGKEAARASLIKILAVVERM